MTDQIPVYIPVQEDDGVSVFALGATLIRNRWRVLRWIFIGGLFAALTMGSRPALYPASASFAPQGNDAARSGLASLAGQFGVAFPTGNQSFSPEFYAKLLKSRVLLREIVRDTFVVQEMGGRRVSFLELFEIKGENGVRREEQGVDLLSRIVTSSVTRSTGVVELSVATRWPSVSLAIASSLVDEVNEFNRTTRQGQATAERKFVQGRLAMAAASLRSAEDDLERFLRTNRQFTGSPELSFERERLQRAVGLRQEVFTSLTQSYEEARVREVRDTPVITVIEPPTVRTQPKPRGRVRRVLLGFVFGGFIGVLVVFAGASLARRRKEEAGEAGEFFDALSSVQDELLRPFRGIKRLIRR